MTPLTVFEELRFILELLMGEWLFLLPFTRRRENFRRKALVGIPAFCLLALGYFLVLRLNGVVPGALYPGMIGGWYILLTLLTIRFAYSCFRVSVSDAIFLCTAGYSVQHMVYTIAREWIARVLWPELRERLGVYILVTVVVTAVVLCLAYLCFAELLQACGGQMITDRRRTVALVSGVFGVLMVSTFLCQSLFENVEAARSYAIALDLLICLLILEVQFVTLQAIRSGQDRVVIEQMLRDSQQRFGMTREMVERVNRTCHDLKHNLQVLKTIDEAERQAYIEEAEANIDRYHQLVHSDNETLNTILAEKSVHCENRGIRLTCAVDGADLDHLSVPDLYALLGNAIDNAVECVDQFEDPEKRLISLTIRGQQGFVSIQTNNYCGTAPELADGLPVTTKADKSAHGFGLKSIRYIAEKYGGAMTVSVEDGIFILQVMLPTPLA